MNTDCELSNNHRYNISPTKAVSAEAISKLSRRYSMKVSGTSKLSEGPREPVAAFTDPAATAHASCELTYK